MKPSKADIKNLYQIKMKEYFYNEVKACNFIVKVINTDYPNLFDRVCDIIEGCKTTTRKYNKFVTTYYHPVYGEIPAYEAGRYPKNVMFVWYMFKILE